MDILAGISCWCQELKVEFRITKLKIIQMIEFLKFLEVYNLGSESNSRWMVKSFIHSRMIWFKDNSRRTEFLLMYSLKVLVNCRFRVHNVHIRIEYHFWIFTVQFLTYMHCETCETKPSGKMLHTQLKSELGPGGWIIGSSPYFFVLQISLLLPPFVKC